MKEKKLNKTTGNEVQEFLETLAHYDQKRRHTSVDIKSRKVGWVYKMEPDKIVVEAMLLYHEVPYIRNKHQKTFKLTETKKDLFPKIEKWWYETATR